MQIYLGRHESFDKDKVTQEIVYAHLKEFNICTFHLYECRGEGIRYHWFSSQSHLHYSPYIFNLSVSGGSPVERGEKLDRSSVSTHSYEIVKVQPF